MVRMMRACPPRHLLQPLDLDTGGNGDEQLARQRPQLGHQRLQHGRHQLGFDRQYDDLSLTGRLGVVLGDADAELVEPLQIEVDTQVAATRLLDQLADIRRT